jgi:tRNA pseudouridine55 synthase
MSDPSVPISTILRVDKPAGPTSHDVVSWARRALGTRKIGHAGTLDPFASGLLVLCIGAGTRVAEYVSRLPKRYEATVRLGARTEGLDTEGEIVEVDDRWRSLEEAGVEEAVAALEGVSKQVPPAFSAKKVAGRRAYQRARTGEVVELEPVSITVHEIGMVRFEPPELDLALFCSSGTYVRALARDLGARLGTNAYLTALRRTQVGRLDVDGAVPGEHLREGRGIPAAAWTSLPEALAHLERVEVSEVEAEKLRHGQFLPSDASVTPDRPLLVMLGEVPVAVAYLQEGQIRPRKVFQP